MFINRTISLLLIVLTGALLSAGGLILLPHYQLDELEPFSADGQTESQYPSMRTNDALVHGRKEYMSLGCAACHTQQVRRGTYGSDTQRGWGPRQTVARDYLGEGLPVTGWQRIGPDPANIGERKPAASWHFNHLYAPGVMTPGSTMPPYRFLFEVIELEPGEPRPTDALDLPPGTVADNIAVIPTRRAHNLVTYLLSLDRTTPLPEAPMAPLDPTEQLGAAQ